VRNILEQGRIHPAIRARIAGYRQDVVREVEAAIAANELQKLLESGELRKLRP
jgi:hypothetical protein